MKVIFLDIDGVLNTSRSVVGLKDTIFYDEDTLGCGLDPVAIGLLHRICKMTDAKIVISSSWRIVNTMDEIKDMFADEFGWKNDLIIGATPVINDSDDTDRRGREIQEWIDTNTVGDMNFQYIIIDDSSDMLDTQRKRFVHVDGTDGLLFRDFKKCLELFGNDFFVNT